MKTREEIEKLKRDWSADPNWKIEETKGFEEYKTELYIFNLETKNAWMRAQISRYEKSLSALREVLEPISYDIEEIRKAVLS